MTGGMTDSMTGKKKWGRFKRCWVWPGLIMLTVFVVSGRSEVAVPRGLNVYRVDLVAHFGVFGALATAWVRIPWFRRRPWLAVVLTSLYGGLDEWHQSMVPGRFMQFDDWVADTLGAWVAVVLYTRWGGYRRILETRCPPGSVARKS